jgi:phosphoglycerate dehydrogenase-like enzyme
VPDRPVVLVSEHLSGQALGWLAARCETVEAQPGEPAFEDACGRAEGLVVRTYTRVDATLLESLPRLRCVGRAGVGLDNIDLAACRARGVEVVHTPEANTQAVVEYVTCLLCDALRPRLFLDHAVSREEWDELREEVVGLWQMNELTLGILGLGRIGKRVAQVASAIGFEVIFHDLLGIPDDERMGARPVPLDELFRESDVLSVHVDGRPSNRHLVAGPLLALLKPDAVLLNTSRGMVIDEADLAAWLELNPAATALLDVHDPEPFGEGSRLISLPNAHLAPHLASRTLTALDNMSWVVKDLVEVLSGRRPRFPAPADAGPG